MTVPVGLVRSSAVEFAANSWIEQQYLHHAEKSGCADSIRFGSEFSYRFDLGHARSARLNMNVGANGANAWSLLVSKDDKVYAIEASGKCWPAWQSVALDKYLAEQGEAPRTIFVKVVGTDCQVREVVLEIGGHES